MTSVPYVAFPLRLPLHYADPKRLRVRYDLAVDDGVQVKVICDDNGTSEWCIERRDSLTFSDSGYGMAEIALRDGLSVWWGDSVDVADLNNRAVTKTRTQLRAYQIDV